MPTEPPVAVVLGATPVAAAIAEHLARDGYDVVTLDGLPDPGNPADATDSKDAMGATEVTNPAGHAGLEEPGAGPGSYVFRALREAGRDPAEGVDAFVHAPLAEGSLTPSHLTALDPVEWERLAEAPIWRCVMALQAAAPLLEPRGGRFVLVAPAVALDGAEGLVAAATAAEAQRALVKSAARRWASRGITFNIVAPDVFAYGAEHLRDTDAGRGEVALTAPTTPAAVADTVALLLDPRSAHLTGATLVVDAGALMAP